MDGGRIVLVTYNVHGFGRPRDPARAARVLADLAPDVVALQEVLLEDRAAQPDVLPALPGYASVFAETLRRGALRYGHALLVRHPLVRAQRLDLSVAGREPRAALDAVVDVRGRALRVVTTHLGLAARERRLQVELLARHLELTTSAGHLALLGDFNEWRRRGGTTAPLDALFGPAPRVASFPARMPLLALDVVWVRPASALVDVRAHRPPDAHRVSDHLPVVAALELV